MHVKHTKYKLIFSILFFVVVDLFLSYFVGSKTCPTGESCPFYNFIFNHTIALSSIIFAFLFYTVWSFFEERKY